MTNYCCINCFAVEDIQEFIRLFDTNGSCDFCNSSKVPIADVKDIRSFIRDGVNRYYENAANEVGFCSAEGGYLYPISDIHDILIHEQEIFSDILTDPIHLLENLVSNDGTSYVRKDPYGEPSGEPIEIDLWKKFCETVKTKQRYTIFLEPEKDDKFDSNNPNSFFYRLANNFMPSLITVLDKGEHIYRARIKSSHKRFKHNDLTSPPIISAKSGRMNPNGISFFYGSKDINTCIHEVRPDIGEEVVVAKFRTLKKLTVLDLSQSIESKRSIFDEEYYLPNEEFYEPFLRYFTEAISRPVRKSDTEIEYIPTQVFTEYIKSINFKNSFSLSNDEDVYLDGLIFRSSANKNGVNVVLFRDSTISTTQHKKKQGSWLKYMSQKSFLMTDINVEFKAS